MEKSSTRQRELAEKRRFWKEQIETWKAGGLKQSEYCRLHQLKLHRFVYWKKRFGDKEAKGSGVSFVQVYPPQLLNNPVGRPPSPLKLLVGDYKIEVQSGFDPLTLKQLVHTLDHL